MKFRSTDINHIDEIPTQDSIIAVTDDSLLAYCADNTLHKVTKPEWRIVEEQNMGLIRDGVLSSYYATLLEFASNNGASTCKAYQGDDAYKLICGSGGDAAWIRWRVDFDKVDEVYIKYQRFAGGGYRPFFRISNSTYDPSSAYWGIWANDRGIFTTTLSKTETTLNVATYKGVHWFYIGTSYNPASYNFFDIELRKAE